METAAERMGLCRYLQSLMKEQQVSADSLSAATGIPPEKLSIILEGDFPPGLDDMIRIGNHLGVKVTFQASVGFAHQKIVNLLKATAV